MAETTHISWCDATFNPWIGCAKIGAGCVNCYAEADFDKRRGKAKWGPNGTRVLTSPANWKKPLKWDREAREDAAATGQLGLPHQRPRVFCASLSDVFEDWQGPIHNHQGKPLVVACDGSVWATDGPTSNCQPLTMADVRRDLVNMWDATPNLDWLILTKRPQNIPRMIPMHWAPKSWGGEGRPPGNIWLGCSASTQAELDAAMPHLLACRDLAPVLFLSLEPLLGPIDVLSAFYRAINAMCCEGTWTADVPDVRDWIGWAIAGGESGPRARPCDVQWIRSIRDQCAAAGVTCFVKQLGTACRSDLECELSQTYSYRGKPADTKGGNPDEWPEDLRVREFPK